MGVSQSGWQQHCFHVSGPPVNISYRTISAQAKLRVHAFERVRLREDDAVLPARS